MFFRTEKFFGMGFESHDHRRQSPSLGIFYAMLDQKTMTEMDTVKISDHHSGAFGKIRFRKIPDHLHGSFAFAAFPEDLARFQQAVFGFADGHQISAGIKDGDIAFDGAVQRQRVAVKNGFPLSAVRDIQTRQMLYRRFHRNQERIIFLFTPFFDLFQRYGIFKRKHPRRRPFQTVDHRRRSHGFADISSQRADISSFGAFNGNTDSGKGFLFPRFFQFQRVDLNGAGFRFDGLAAARPFV